MPGTSTPTATDAPATDPNQHLYFTEQPCWVAHLPGQDVNDEVPHYNDEAAADRAATESGWWTDERAAGLVPQVDQLDSRCLAARCAECRTVIDEEPYHYTSWEEVAEQARHTDTGQLEHTWQVDHDTRLLWCGGCKVTRRTPAEHEDSFGLWMGPQIQCRAVDIAHLPVGDRILLSLDAWATVTAPTTLHHSGRIATVHTDKGSHTTYLPCTARVFQAGASNETTFVD